MPGVHRKKWWIEGGRRRGRNGIYYIWGEGIDGEAVGRPEGSCDGRWEEGMEWSENGIWEEMR